jgi:hypothetical protein
MSWPWSVLMKQWGSNLSLAETELWSPGRQAHTLLLYWLNSSAFKTSILLTFRIRTELLVFIIVRKVIDCEQWLKLKFKLKLLRPTVSWPVCLVVRRPSGTCDQFFFLLEISFRQFHVCYFVAPSLKRGRVCNLLYNCFWDLPEQSLLGGSPAELTAMFYCLIWGSPNLEGQVPIFISPRNRVAQLYSRALGSLYVASYDSLGCGGGILTRLHTGERPMEEWRSYYQRQTRREALVIVTSCKHSNTFRLYYISMEPVTLDVTDVWYVMSEKHCPVIWKFFFVLFTNLFNINSYILFSF